MRGRGNEMDRAPQCQGKQQDLRCSTYSGPRAALVRWPRGLWRSQEHRSQLKEQFLANHSPLLPHCQVFHYFTRSQKPRACMKSHTSEILALLSCMLRYFADKIKLSGAKYELAISLLRPLQHWVPLAGQHDGSIVTV